MLLTSGGGDGPTDLDRLAAFDSNGDGLLTSADARFSEFRVWRDLNQNGATDQGELFGLAELGINSINLNGTAVSGQGGDIRYWADVNGDGVVDEGEVFETVGDAPAGAIPIRLVDGGAILNSTTVTTATGTLNAYSVGLSVDPVGAKARVDGSDVILDYEDGRSDRFRIVQTATGQQIDLTDGTLSGAFGNDGADVLQSSGTRNVMLFGLGGNDVLTGGQGDDVIAGGTGADKLDGGLGDDILFVDAQDLGAGVTGGAGRDTVFVETADAASIDLAATQVEAVFGNAGNDTLNAAGVAVDVMLSGGAGDDTLTGGAGSDYLDGGTGSDALSGGAGDDILMIDATDSQIQGGDGRDAVYVTTASAVTLDLTAASVEMAFGNAGNDVFTASGATAVTLSGEGGNDTLTGGSGDDRLVGGTGSDAINGGDGLDVAVFSGKRSDYTIAVAAGGGYTITDNNAADGDDGTDTVVNVERLAFADETVHLDAPNSVPVASDEIWRVRDNGGALLLSETGLLRNDFDVDSDRLNVTAISRARGGDVSITAAGDVLFDAEGPFGGTGGFDYRIEDGKGGSAWGRSRVEVSRALPTDELFEYQWALDALNVYDVWDDYTGIGVKVGLQDDGVDALHPDLQSNYDPALQEPGMALGNGHGTYVSALVGAAANGEGIVGIAHGATIANVEAPAGGIFGWNFGDLRRFDVVSNSWAESGGGLFSNGTTSEGDVSRQIREHAEEGRGGLGTIFVFSSSNEGHLGEDSNQRDGQNDRHAVVVGAVDNTGKIADFSTTGTSVLVVAPGVGIVSADNRGASGLSGESGGLFGSDYMVGDGTSASAPLVAGVIALMLQANPNLGWRDVQEILAYSAWNTDPNNPGWSTNAAGNWNGGGLHVNRDYGFGMVDARAAVRLAETWQKSSTSANETSATAANTAGGAIPDNTGGAYVGKVTVTADIEIDQVEVLLNITHPNIGDLIVELTSPDGTTSVILERIRATADLPGGSPADNIHWRFTTTHNWGESSLGEWTLTVRDAATGEVGRVDNWTLKIYGDAASENDTYIYTADYGAMTSGVDTARRLLTDGVGHDAINAAAIFEDAFLDLRPGATSQLAGNELKIAVGTVIEDAYLGDGHDEVIGNDVANTLSGGRGDDILEGGAGADRLDGGRGLDTARYAGSTAGVSIDLAAGTASGGDAAGDTLIAIENLEGSALADSLAGDAQDNSLVGNGGNDILAGAAGNDTLLGGDGADQLLGGDGDDELAGGAGNDSLDGGIGSDRAVYSGRWVDYVISASGGTVTIAGPDGTDTLTGVEFAVFADRTIYLGGLNAAPTAPGMTIELSQRGARAVSEEALLSGALDADGDTLSLAAVHASANGLVTLTSSNDVRFTIDEAFVGTTSFDYIISDGKGGEVKATATVVVHATSEFTGSTSGDDVFRGLGSADRAFGGAGNDLLDGGYGNDELIGGIGDDVLIGGAGADMVSGGDGSDTASYETARAGVTVSLAAGSGSRGDADGDTLSGIENLTGSTFADVLTGDAGANQLDGLAGNDVIDGGGGADSLRGGNGNDLLIGGADADTLLGGSGDDVLRGGSGADVLDGGAGIDVVSYLDATEAVSINLGTGAKSGADAIGDVFVSIEGVEGSNFNDTLTGTESGDMLSGAGGNDRLAGLGGSDVYSYSAGDGDDTIEDYYYANQTDQLIFGAGLTAGRLIIDRSTWDPNDVTLRFRDQAGSIAIDQQFVGSGWSGIERFTFGDGRVWSGDDLKSAYLRQVQTAGNDTVRGFDNRNDSFDAGAGDDSISGYSGSDSYRYEIGDGNDSILEYGGAVDTDRLVLGVDLNPADLVIDRTGWDKNDVTIRFRGRDGSIAIDQQFSGSAGDGIEEFVFGDGTIWSKEDFEAAYLAQAQTAGDDTIYGFGYRADTLQGGIGNDSLLGLGGADTYVYNQGDGDDVIYEAYGPTGDVDRLILGGGLLRSNAILTRSTSDLRDYVLSFAGLSGSITLNMQGEAGGYGIEEIVFGDGTTWSWGKIFEVANGVVASQGAESLHGAGGVDDTLQGLGGNDTLTGYSGSDTYLYDAGHGDDVIREGAFGGDVDRLSLGAGITSGDVKVVRSTTNPDDVTLQIGGASPGKITLEGQFAATAGSGIEEVAFAGGTIWTADDIKAAALGDATTPGDDVINGFDGRADQLAGGGGDDRLVGYSGGDTYVVNANEGNDTIVEGVEAGAVDRIVFGAGLTTANLVIERPAADRNDMVLRFSGYSGSVVIDDQFHHAGGGIESVLFGDGTTFSREDLYKFYAGQSANVGNDTIDIRNVQYNSWIYAGGGDDVIYSSNYWTQIYYDLGDGNDRISQFRSGELIFGTGITQSNISVRRDPSDVYSTLITLADGGTIKLQDTFAGGGGGSLRFSDGAVWTWQQIKEHSIIHGTANAEAINGTDQQDVIEGGGGADTLSGGSMGDTYLYSAGDGNDTISEGMDFSDPSQAQDRLVLRGILATDVQLQRDGMDVKLVIGGTGEIIRLQDQYRSGYGIERVEFDDGTVWTKQFIADAVGAIVGTAGDDQLSGLYGFADRLIGGRGDDRLSGYSGADTYDYAVGDGNDTINDEGYENASVVDTLKLTDLLPADIALSIDGDALIVTIIATGHVIRVTGQFAYDIMPEPGQDYSLGIERILFADGTAWDGAAIKANAGFGPTQNLYTGTSGADVINGDFWHNTIDGLGGDDTIDGLGGADLINGGAGNDILRGGLGDDRFIGETGDGDDAIDGGGGSDRVDYSRIQSAIVVDLAAGTATGADIGSDSLANIEGVQGGQGDDRLSGGNDAESLDGSGGNDILRGGRGDDNLSGGEGSDTFEFDLGDGVDRVAEFAVEQDVDRIVFGAGIAATDVSFALEDFESVLRVGTGGDKIILSYQFGGSGGGIEEVHFADGTIWGLSDLAQRYIAAQVSTGSDYVMGTSLGDVIEALGGDDAIFGEAGDDQLRGGDGDDYMVGGTGADLLDGGNGADSLEGGDGNDNYIVDNIGDTVAELADQGWDEVHTSLHNYVIPDNFEALKYLGTGMFTGTGNDLDNVLSVMDGYGTLEGRGGNDLLYGGSGDDILLGGDGNDELYVGEGTNQAFGGEGEDVLYGAAGNDELHGDGGNDTFYAGAGNDVLYGGAGNDTLYGDGGSNWFDGGDGDDVIFLGPDASIAFGGAGSDTFYGAAAGDTHDGGDGNDFVYANDGNDIVRGGAGDDDLFGDAGDDRIAGETGNDWIGGGDGSDTFVFAKNDGNDIIVDFVAGTDKIELSGLTGINTFADVLASVVENPDDIVIDFGAEGSMRLYGVTKASLQAGDFTFV